MNVKSQDRSPTLFDYFGPLERSDKQDGGVAEKPKEPPVASVALTDLSFSV